MRSSHTRDDASLPPRCCSCLPPQSHAPGEFRPRLRVVQGHHRVVARKIMRQVIRLRKKDVSERQEEEAILDLYIHALRMAPDEEGPDR